MNQVGSVLGPGVSLAVLALGLTSCSNSVTSPSPNPNPAPSAGPAPTMQWVVGWGAPAENALSAPGNTGGSEQSFRFIVLPTTDGTQERVHFSNRLGAQPVTIGAARVAAAVGVGPAIDPTRDAPLTFNSSASVTIPAGQEVVSDPVNVSYSFGEKLAVSVYLKGSFGPLTQHTSEVQTNFETAVGAGNSTGDSTGASFGTAFVEWFMVTGVDVYGSYQGTVAVFGSSSVDGHNSNFGDTNSYPVANVAIASQDNDRPSDWLARQLRAAGYRMGVLNAGAIGDPAGRGFKDCLGGDDCGAWTECNTMCCSRPASRQSSSTSAASICARIASRRRTWRTHSPTWCSRRRLPECESS